MNTTPSTPAAPEESDPSMEDILASIRRILNEDEAPSPPAKPSEPPAEDEVLVLDSSMMVVPGEPAPVVAKPEPDHAPDVHHHAADDHPAPLAPEPMEQEAGAFEPSLAVPDSAPLFPEMEAVTLPAQATEPGQTTHGPDLLAPEAAAAAASSVDSLLRTLATSRTTQVYSGGPTLEDLVRAELRPLLKEWLSVNLPPVVERLVRAEIERVVGRSL